MTSSPLNPATHGRVTVPMKTSNAVVLLSALIAVLALVAAGTGLFWQGGGNPFSFTTLRGDTLEMYGRGLYRYDALRNGPGYRGADAYIIVFAVPLLVLCTLLYRRGSLRGGLLLTGTLAYFLYNSASMTFGYAYNNLFLVYLAQFSASLFAFVLAFTSIDLRTLPSHFSTGLPRRGITVFLFAVGVSLIAVWVGLSILPALLQGKAPGELTSYTTLVTHALDVGIIAPVYFLAGVLLVRGAPLGYLLTTTLLVLSWVLGAGVLVFSAAQVLAGVLTTGQVVGFVVPFVILTVVGIWLMVVLFRNFSDPATSGTARVR